MPNSAAISESADAIPAAPQSWSDSTRPEETISTEASISFLPVNGSPICTDGRFSAASSPSSWLARTEAPPIPSRPVVAPLEEDDCAAPGRLRARHPVGRGGARRTSRSRGSCPGRPRRRPPRRRRSGRRRSSRSGRCRRRRARSASRARRSAAVEERDRARAHRDDVAEDPADAGRGALERLDRGRVVVALDLEGDREPLAEVEDAGVLARALEHALARAREALQEERRVLVAAVLRPEEREDGELEVVRVPAEQGADALVLPVGQAEGAMERLFRPRCSPAAPPLMSVAELRGPAERFLLVFGKKGARRLERPEFARAKSGRGRHGETWFPPRTRAEGEQCSGRELIGGTDRPALRASAFHASATSAGRSDRGATSSSARRASTHVRVRHRPSSPGSSCVRIGRNARRGCGIPRG